MDQKTTRRASIAPKPNDPHGAEALGPRGRHLSALAATLNGSAPVQRLAASAPPNRTGLPNGLKAGIENLSGMSLDHVRVHRNSAAPAQLDAHAYAQGSDIHLAPGQEQHLPHEAWHVVQQAQGRVRPTMQMKGDTAINDDASLEHEADTMGRRAQAMTADGPAPAQLRARNDAVAQLTKTVNVKRTQELVEDESGGKLSGTTFGWQSKFDVDIISDKVVVTIRIKSNVDPMLFQSVWANQVTAQWSNRFMIKAGDKSYPIVVNLLQVDSGEHYAVKPVKSDSALHSGGRAHFGTEDMTTWGVHDTTNVSHEVGHMLGNVDEYGKLKVDGQLRDYKTTPSSTIMAVSANNPIASHYYLIKWAADQELTELGLLKDKSEVLPDPGSRLGGHQSNAIGLSAIKSGASGLKKVVSSKKSDEESDVVPEFVSKKSQLKPPTFDAPVPKESSSSPKEEISPSKRQYDSDMKSMNADLRSARRAFKEHPESWVIERLVTYIERIIQQYRDEYVEGVISRRWCVNATAGIVDDDIPQAIKEKGEEGGRPWFMNH